MKNFLGFFSAFLVLTLSATAFGQGMEGSRIGKLLPEKDGLAHLSYTYTHRSSFDEAPADNIAYHTIDFGGQFPIEIRNDFYFAVGAHYNLHHFHIQNITGYFAKNSLYLHAIGVPLDAFFFFNDKWMLDLNFTPIIASDLKSFDTGDIQYYGAALAGFAFSDSAAFYFGVGFGKELRRYLPFPLLGFVFKPENSFFELETILPAYIRMNFKVAKPVTLFVLGEFNTYVWDVEGSGTIPDHDLKFTDTRAGGGAMFKIINGLFVEVYSGVNPYRKYELRDNTGATIKRKQKIQFFGQATISITPALFFDTKRPALKKRSL